MTHTTPTPAHARLAEKLAIIGLTDEARARDFAAWLTGLTADRLPELARLTTGEAEAAAQRIEAHWFHVALIDEWQEARAQEAANAARPAEEVGEEWLR